MKAAEVGRVMSGLRRFAGGAVGIASEVALLGLGQ